MEGTGGKGEWDAGPAGRQVPGAPHWQKTGLGVATPVLLKHLCSHGLRSSKKLIRIIVSVAAVQTIVEIDPVLAFTV